VSTQDHKLMRFRSSEVHMEIGRLTKRKYVCPKQRSESYATISRGRTIIASSSASRVM
jgi:hypothetical protein